MFDKTGTLTSGVFVVSGSHHNGKDIDLPITAGAGRERTPTIPSQSLQRA